MSIENVIIIGSGPAAHTAAIYTARANLQPLLFEGEMAGGVAAGGQLTTTTDIENFPGFPAGIMGAELMMNMREQALRFGTRILTKTITRADFSTAPFQVWSDDDSWQAQSIIIATGATAKRMFVPGESRLWQRGISACAVCDGGLPLFRNQPLFVVGGGDTACEEALFLARFGSSVTMLVRRDQLRASQVMQNRMRENPKISVLWNTVLVDVLGETRLAYVRVRNVITSEETDLPATGLFYAIGHQPNTAFLANQIALDEAGYIQTAAGSTHTSAAGVFAAGDVQDHRYRQAITAAGSGCMAALDVQHYLEQL